MGEGYHCFPLAHKRGVTMRRGIRKRTPRITTGAAEADR